VVMIPKMRKMMKVRSIEDTVLFSGRKEGYPY
jgi:hypothetical protein